MKEYKAGTYLFTIWTSYSSESWVNDAKTIESRAVNFETASKAAKLLDKLISNSERLGDSTLGEDASFLRTKLTDELNLAYIHGYSVYYFEGDVKDVTENLK